MTALAVALVALISFPIGLVAGNFGARLVFRITDNRKEQRHGHRESRGGHRDHRARASGTDPRAGTREDGHAGNAQPGAAAGAGAGVAPATGPYANLAHLHAAIQAAHPGSRLVPAGTPLVALAGRRRPASEWYSTQGRAYHDAPITIRRSDDTVTAWKRAAVDMIAEAPGEYRPVLVGPVTGRYLAVDYGTAQCTPLHAAGTPHPGAKAPRVDCTCGFYAVSDRDVLDTPLSDGLATLEVELFGRVIRHARGYRSQHQRVLSITLDRLCHVCMDSAATVVGVGGDVWTSLLARYLYGGGNPHRSWCGTLCDSCRETHQPAATFTTDALAHTLGTEVRWGVAA